MSAYEKRLDVRIGEALRTRREAVGMTQAQLGKAIGVTFQQIQKYERGVNRIAGSKLVIAAEALKCDPALLFGEPQVDLPGSGRLMRAWSRLDPRQREAVTALVEAFGPGPGDV
jgi:transcriptional regulator with XRE-family HTH domain